MNDDNSKSFQFDKSMILYNNCSEVAVLNNLCIGIVGEYNAHSGTLDAWYNSGKLRAGCQHPTASGTSKARSPFSPIRRWW